MGPRDRKRFFSNAFYPSNNSYRKALRTMTGSSASSEPFYSPTVLFGSNKENKNPFLDTKTGMKTHNDCQSPTLSPLGPRIHSDPNVSFDFDDMLGLSSPTGPVIFEDLDTALVQPNYEGKVGPTILCFQDLSLHDGPETSFLKLYQSSIAVARTSVAIVESHSLQHLFPNLDPSDLVICFDKGKQAAKINKHLLSKASHFFATILHVPCLDGHTCCIRLRDDFPHAIAAMMQFVENDIYAFTSAMRAQYPNMTLLDLHIHAYIVGEKYAVPALCNHAISEYLKIGHMILSMRTIRVVGNNAVSSAANSFLDSLVLIWRNTRHRKDALRQAVLELLKPKVHQLLRIPFFQTLMLELAGFGEDVVDSLAEDGFDVQVFPVVAGLQEKGGIRFGGV